MLLKDSFYTIQDQTSTDTTHQSTVLIDAQHPIFKGHFPGNPVTPGVVQLEMIKELVGLNLGKTAQLKKMVTCKFLAILNPELNSTVSVVLDIQEAEGNGVKVAAQIKDDATVYLKMNGEYYF